LAEDRRVAVVTGGASGIGLGVAKHLAEEGMSVVASDWDEQACAAARESLGAFGDRVRVVVADIGTPEGAEKTIDAAIDSFGRLDTLVNNAAVHPFVTLEEMDISAWREVFRVNVEGTLLCSKAALPHMKRQGSGSIIIMGSVSGVLPYIGGGAYATTKAALAMLTRVLALEAGPSGVRVNCIAPGAIRHRVAPGESQAAPANIPIGRAGTIDDVAHMVSYLASDQATYLTGSIIVLDGGATAGRVRQQRG
jgi:NAD(P)-dependent dehydrogenase (short-subunit alcohol dehydrogenase family)